MASIRELKGRIGSVSTSEKITGAMKMISSAKMHKAMQALQRVEPFRHQIQSTIDNLLAADSQYTSPLTQVRPIKSVGIVLLGSDEGLCGAFNMMLFKQMLETINRIREEENEEVTFTLYPIGKKVVAASRKLALPSVKVAEIDYMNAKSSGEKIKQLCDELTQSFLGETLDRIEIVFMEFLSVGRQRLANRIMLPIVTETPDNIGECKPYLFEPDVTTIFDEVLPLSVLASLQESICQNRASEQAARVLAMQSANDNAKKLREELQLEYNKLRQQSITNELLDILGGKVEG
ncbi:MAG: ATP synthase F1 subunit gamma [Bacteroidaceae bacterium]|nr:ATP synthase F1 subunit gamma [Bacteroidaceae bacterium]